ncbi:Rne/Rng family ribonuclease [Halocella sp. SP3-1]|uniref:Rne/Rng family ribonuclease n=1 Tax=Halocella sp. SP3-1 TaxID=2382161 RepID=UPI000F74EDAA|nr:Rne/Rng family ribonuclease [Halocella sp. SP3-1]AZO94318.1 Rne/Rng family ribonuclease [Halocella sp. SP3-1]
MSRQIIINSGIREKRAGILVNNRLEDVFFEQDTYEQIAGNIYSGIVRDVLPGMQAAFVDIGSDRNAFLHISDLFPILNTDQLERWKNNKLGIQHVLQPGQELLIQVIKEAIGSKGPKVTCKITIPGRYFVLLPYENRVNISRKINEPEERQRLSKLTDKLLGDKYGVIIRTNAAGKGYDELKMDLDYLTHTWDEVQNENSKKNAPSLIYQHVGLIQQIIRDHLSDDIDKLVIDNHDDYQKIVRMLNKISPHLSKKIVYYQRKNPIFTVYGIEKELSRVLNRRVWLDSGGYIIIDKTEALVAIDVNTGKYTGKKNLQDTVFKTNLEAAKEIARQLRLRDIGGIIIIDFIDMTIREHQERVLAVLSKELARDKTKTALLGLTQLGLVEMTRKKVREGYGELIQKECPYCQGTGMVVSEGTMSLRVIREINELAVNEDFSALYLEMHPRVAAVLIGTGGEKLAELEEKFALDIYVSGNDELHIEDYTIKKGKKEEMADLALPVKEGEEYRLLIEEKQLNNPEDGIARIKGYIIIIKGGGHLVGDKLNVKITDVARTFARAEIIK